MSLPFDFNALEPMVPNGKKQRVIFRFEHCQLRERYRERVIVFFYSLTWYGKQKSKKLGEISRDCKKEEYVRLVRYYMGIVGDINELVKREKQSRELCVLEHMKVLEEMARPCDKAIYHAVAKHFASYLKSAHNRDDIPFALISSSTLLDFRDYLLVHVYRGALACRTAYKYFALFCRTMQEAYERRLLCSNPLYGIKPIPIDEDERRDYLTKQEVIWLKEAPLPKTRFNARLLADYFLFLCYSGMRDCDAREIRWSDVVYTNGITFIHYIPKHAERNCQRIVILSSDALKILERRKRKTEKIFDGLPSRATINAFVKRWLQNAVIKKPVTVDDARLTYKEYVSFSDTRDFHLVLETVNHLIVKQYV